MNDWMNLKIKSKTKLCIEYNSIRKEWNKNKIMQLTWQQMLFSLQGRQAGSHSQYIYIVFLLG